MSGRILVGSHDGVYVVRFEGDVRVTLSGSFDHYVEVMLKDPTLQSVLVDLNDAIAIDSTSLGCLAKLSLQVQKRRAKLPTLVCQSQDILRVLRNMGFEDVFAIVDERYQPDQSLVELPVPHDMSESAMREKVIDAHKVLMSLNQDNAEAFKDLVLALEMESQQTDTSDLAASQGASPA